MALKADARLLTTAGEWDPILEPTGRAAQCGHGIGLARPPLDLGGPVGGIELLHYSGNPACPTRVLRDFFLSAEARTRRRVSVSQADPGKRYLKGTLLASKAVRRDTEGLADHGQFGARVRAAMAFQEQFGRPKHH